MTPSHRSRNGCEAAQNLRWRNAAPPVSSLKRTDGAPKPWPIVPHPKRQVHRSHFHSPPPLPHLRLFHTRHAEESAERPHLVTVVRPCSQSPLRKVTVLLNRRGVASYDQLLLDISEALGFPRWHRARVTRLYTTHAQEVKGVCDFFRGEVAFLALGKARPELSSVQEAVEELFPEHSQYRADALQAWEKKLRPAPDKAAKADSGYSDGTDGSETHTSQGTHPEANTQVKHPANTHKVKQPHQHIDTQPFEKHISDAQTCHKSNACRKPAHLPNHLQRLHVRGGVRERQPSVIGLFKHKESLREADLSSTTLCENCLARRDEPRHPERINPLAPLPPVSRKQKQGSNSEPVRISSPPPPLSSREEEKSHLHLSDPHPNLAQALKGLQSKTTFDLSSDGSDVTQADIERCYEIGRVVGDGNFAVVRECRHRGNGQTLAVKIVERSKLIGREHMMQNELSLLGSLCHPRIVRLFAHHHTHTHSYLVMELVRGGDLFEAISERGKFSEPEAGLMVSDMGEALNYIHCKSIVHRDLKPENLLIEHEAAGLCRLKLGDFGLAMVVTEPVFTICGTPTYVAPEILCEMGYGVAVDVWALGVILFVLLCGFPPFRSRDRDQEELFQLIKQGQIHFLSPYWDSISEEARGLVRVLLQPDPRVRLTAEQTLLHPWVEAMTSICQQRALVDKHQRNTGDTEAEPDRVQRLDQTNAAVTGTDITPLYSPGEGLIRHKKLSRHEDRQTEMSAGGRIRVQTPSKATAGQKKPERTTTDSISPCKETSRREIQDPDSKLSYRNCYPGSPIIKAHEC